MIYIDVVWKQTNPDYPIRICSELDGEGWEQRKIEIFMDGRLSYASKLEENGPAALGLEPVPSISEIQKNQEFEAKEITAQEFEQNLGYRSTER